MQIRKLFSDKLTRGKIDVVLRYKRPEEQKVTINIDHDLAKSLVNQYDALAVLTTRPVPIDMLKVLQWPNVLQAETRDQNVLNKAVIAGVTKAIEALIERVPRYK